MAEGKQEKPGRHARIHKNFFSELIKPTLFRVKDKYQRFETHPPAGLKPIKITRAEVLIYLAIRLHADELGLCEVSINSLHKLANIHYQVSQRAIRMLEARQLIKHRHRKGQYWHFQT